MRRTVTLIAALLAFGATPATGAEIVGSDLAAVPNNHTSSPTTFFQRVQPPAVTLPMAVSSPGVIVQVRIRHNTPPALATTAGFSILSGTFPSFSARTSAGLPDFQWTVADGTGIRSFAPNPGIPIAAGERLAYRQVSNNNSPQIFRSGDGGTFALRSDSHTAGTLSYTDNPAGQLLMQYTVEPDVDVDGFGDESQDNTPSACRGLTVTKFGTPGNDAVIGTAGDDVISTGGGDDLVLGLGGNDILCGGDGNDILKGGPGKDRLFGEAGRDKLKGGAAKDYCNGGLEQDKASKCEKAKQI